MSGAHIHLLMTHLPVLGTVFGLVLLLYAFVRKNRDATKVSLGVFVLSALFAGAVYLTGEAAEEVVEGMTGISEAVIEVHEEAALYALVASLMLGVVSLGGLVLFFRKRIPAWFTATALVLALITSGVMAWTANLGGQINHPEIRSDQVTAQAGDQQQPSAREAEEGG